MNRRTARSLVLPILVLAGRVAGQTEDIQPVDDGPVVVGTPRETWKTFELIKLESALEFRFQHQSDEISQTGTQDQTTTESRYRALFDLQTEMAFGHRNLVDLTANVQLGAEKINVDSSVSGSEEDETDFVHLWDLNALIFGTSSMPTDIFARREQSILDRPFAGTIEETLTEEGIATRIGGSEANASFRYFHRETELDGGFGNLKSNVTQDSFTAQANARLTPSQRLESVYIFDYIDESQAGGFADAYDRHDLNLVHTYAFDLEDQPDELRSSFRMYRQGGSQEQQTLRLDESLTLRHTERLETRYNLTLDTRDVRGQQQDLVRADASIRHRLFESLTSTATIGAQRVTAPGDFSSDELFASGQLDYTKKVPYGRLDASAGVSLNHQVNSARGSNFSIFNEPYVFNDGFPIILPRRNVVPGSIVITPAAGFPVFQEGIDYTATILPDRTEIRGILGGAFVDGETLLISYDIGPDPGNTIDTTGTVFSIRYTFTEGWMDGVSLYSTYRTIGHTVDTDDPTTFILDDVNDLLLGAEYRVGGLDLTYEYNNHDSTFDPYIVNRFQVLYIYPLGPGSSLSADASREFIEYTEQANEVTFDRASLRWNYRLNEDFDLNARLEYRHEDSQSRGDSQGLEEVVGVSWHRRQTTIYCNVRNSTVDSDNSNESAQLLQLGLRRVF